ncbi:MAG: hypothetical protein NUW23_02390 [Firmicutes bacterium]|jgi:small subunit ribosomal protein S1|nr:hypothetical protein [Bacillota bacterium]
MIKLIEGYKGEKRDFAVDPWPDLFDAMRRGHIVQEDVIGLERIDGKDALIVSFGPVKGVIMDEEIGDNRPKSLTSFVGIPVAFKVIHCDKASGTVMLSRRAALETLSKETWQDLKKEAGLVIELTQALDKIETDFAAEKKKGSVDRQRILDLRKQRLEIMNRIAEVAPVKTCTVRWVSRFRASVDIGGVMADLPAKELSHGLVLDAREVVAPGDSFDVKILKIYPDTQTVVVTLKALLPDPWASQPFKYQVGGLYRGRIVREKERGNKRRLVVELEPGINAEIWKPVAGAPSVGAEVKVAIRRIKPENHYIEANLVSQRTAANPVLQRAWQR